MKVVLIGSIGAIGRPLTQELVKKGHSVTVVTRTAEREKMIEALGAKAAVGTMYDPEFLSRTFQGAEVVYTMITHDNTAFFEPDFDLSTHYTQIAEVYMRAITRSGVKKVVHLSSFAGFTDKESGILRCHHGAERILNQLSEEVSIKFVRPVGFYTNLFAFIQSIKTKGAIFQNYGGDEKQPWVSPLDIASTIAEEIEMPFNGRTVRYIASDEVSPNEVADMLGAAIDKPDLKWIVITDEQLLDGLLAAGINKETAKGLVELNAGRRGGLLYEDYFRNRPTLGKVKLLDFAKHFAAVYNS